MTRSPRDRRLLSVAPVVTTLAMLVPIAAGLIGTALPAFGYLPAIGGHAMSLAPWRTLLSTPGFASSLRISVQTGVVATAIAVALAIGFCASAQGIRPSRRISALLAPVLATPHSALAIGLAFLIAPSGWLVRLALDALGIVANPPDVATVGDAQGVAMIAALVLKETPFLILMIESALHQVAVPRAAAVARSLGYAPAEGWLKLVLPQVYPQIRVPVYAVLAFSLSVVDVALIVGPDNPPPLSVLALRGFSDADVARWFPAAAAACLLFGVCVVAIAAWRFLERGVAAIGVRWIERGHRGRASGVATRTARLIVIVALIAAMLSILDLAVWSFVAQWRFPDAWPSSWTLANWTSHWHDVGASTAATLRIAAASSAIALLVTLGCLENESRRAGRPPRLRAWIVYVPLLVPQIAFLFGVEVLLARAGVDGTWLAVAALHVVFVLPYLFLALADPWRALDPRYARSAAALGASPARVFVRVKLPLLLRPILMSTAIGFAVSVSQYLPTVFAGAGRVATLTTDAVTLSSGADRRVAGVYAALQALLPLLAFLAAAGVSASRRTGRRATMQRA
jgi:putative thiamine transport system permease protein